MQRKLVYKKLFVRVLSHGAPVIPVVIHTPSHTAARLPKPHVAPLMYG